MYKWVLSVGRMVAGAFILCSTTLWAASSDTASVAFVVNALNEIDFSGSPATLTINGGTAGGGLTPAMDTTTQWAITTNGVGKKVTAQLNSNMPAGVTLSIQLAAPTGATSLGSVAVSTTTADLVTGITQLSESGLSVTYVLSASVSAATTVAANRIVTFTISS